MVALLCVIGAVLPLAGSSMTGTELAVALHGLAVVAFAAATVLAWRRCRS